MKNKIYYENFKDAIERNRKKIPAVHKKLKAAGVQYVMSRMDRLFGVTMAERGVSQIVSVDLKKAEEIGAVA